MIRLYHFAGAICAQKVRVCLAEKGIAWESRIVADNADGLRSAEYLALNPNGYVPTLVHDDRVLIESRLINEYLDTAFPESPLTPAYPYDRYRAATWTKQVDDSLHLNIYVLTFLVLFRDGRLALSPEELRRSLPLTNPIKREYTLALIDHGASAAPVRPALARFDTLLADMNAALDRHEWLAGHRYSLADTDLTPYAARLQSLGLWPMLSRRYPNVQRWFAAVQERPSFRTGITDWFTEADRQRIQQKVEVMRRDLETLGRAA